MPTSAKCKAAASMLVEAWKAETTFEGLPVELFPSDLDEAVAIQDEVARQMDERVIGWKIGGAPGPMVGRVFLSTLYTTPALLPLRRFPASNIECELGFRMTRNLNPRAQAYRREEAMDAAVLAFTIELTGTRYTDGVHTARNDRELRALVADNSANAGLIVGPEAIAWRDLSLLDIPVTLRINGGAPLPPNPRDRRTDPTDVLVWFVNELSRRGIGISAGQWITTGSATLPTRLKAGDRVFVQYGEFGAIEASLVE